MALYVRFYSTLNRFKCICICFIKAKIDMSSMMRKENEKLLAVILFYELITGGAYYMGAYWSQALMS